MKESALLVNVARGGVVVEAELFAAIASGQIAGAALDVFSEEGVRSPFADLSKVLLTPHIGAMTGEAQMRVGQAVMEGIDAAFSGRRIRHRVR